VIAGLLPKTIQIPYDGLQNPAAVSVMCTNSIVLASFRSSFQSLPIFLIPWIFFACCLLIFMIMPVAVIRSVLQLASEKGRSPQFFPQPDFVQESSGVRTAVLSHVLFQDGYNIVPSSAVLRTAIATAGSRLSGSCPEYSADDSHDLGTVRTAVLSRAEYMGESFFTHRFVVFTHRFVDLAFRSTVHT
jgi:hypothetical protein